MRDYRSTSGVWFEPIAEDPLTSDIIALSHAYKTAPLKEVRMCVPFPKSLLGRKWDETALAVVSTLKPTYIRVTEGALKTDWRPGRVTVGVDKNNVIQWGNTEIEVTAYVPDTFTQAQIAEVQDLLNGNGALLSISGRG
ncbi:hypothetical protein [Ralstonia phage phiRSL1]|uniref:Uncharacterized protein n=1 Tax=Ralstonia phage phiRSL1 TaxID=1980924 RepID=B2ZYE5_9CAUD|nr:hypothetical protein RSL1_ORF242 [Ralstonia phage phiRSL1]BAG41691.1 hypothetical protein [Ralstonia phage phiRSL1]